MFLVHQSLNVRIGYTVTSSVLISALAITALTIYIPGYQDIPLMPNLSITKTRGEGRCFVGKTPNRDTVWYGCALRIGREMRKHTITDWLLGQQRCSSLVEKSHSVRRCQAYLITPHERCQKHHVSCGQHHTYRDGNSSACAPTLMRNYDAASVNEAAEKPGCG
ncbi:hypothetical protein DFH94DRAFT_782516 [Russula ochroleuca]|uniref:Uncharacterized protein n=1 Tax=Russula ochroleuca TaxID=152965 RepID=A0A9P5JW61_9AGAM|nr:hypothetical protein DFH94DRAFT_782516 [Russula ochroleuca]